MGTKNSVPRQLELCSNQQNSCLVRQCSQFDIEFYANWEMKPVPEDST